MYKEIIRNKTRFATVKGSLSVEQLWDLSIDDLDTLAVTLDDAYNSSKGKSFVKKRTVKDKNLKGQLDVVVDILNTKQEEAETLKTAAAVKEHNTKIFELIAQKKEGELAGKSVEELESLLK